MKSNFQRSNRNFVIILLPLFAFLMSCGAQDLERDEAAKIIASASQFQEYRLYVLVQENAEELGVSQGWWQSSRGKLVGFSDEIRSEAVKLDRTMFGFGQSYFVLNKPVDIAIHVTGITGDETGHRRVAEFEWKYENLPPLTRRIALVGGTGRAAFQLYDDGWRLLEIVSMTAFEDPYPLSDDDRRAMASDIARERERRAAAAIAAAEAKRTFENRMREASTRTKELRKHSFEQSSIYGGKLPVYITVTDVSVLIEAAVKKNTYPRQHVEEYLFASVRRPYVPAGYDNNGYLYIGQTFLTDRKQKDSKEFSEIINSINRAFEDWKRRFAILVAECEKSKTWGCVEK